MTTVTIEVHVEAVDGAPVWWADSDDVDGFYAAADSMEQLRVQVIAALGELLGDTVELVERLAGKRDREMGDASIAVAADDRLLMPA